MPKVVLSGVWGDKVWLEDTIASKGVTYEEVVDPIELIEFWQGLWEQTWSGVVWLFVFLEFMPL